MSVVSAPRDDERSEEPQTSLGFTWRVASSGEVTVRRSGRIVTTLRGRAAGAFVAQAATLSPGEIQQRLARLTGNYRRGNERAPGGHPRNR
jgi:hypothetical protein